MLDPLLVALWQATTAERRGLAKSAPGPVGSGLVGSGRGPVSLSSPSIFLYPRKKIVLDHLRSDYRLSTVNHRPSFVDCRSSTIVTDQADCQSRPTVQRTRALDYRLSPRIQQRRVQAALIVADQPSCKQNLRSANTLFATRFDVAIRVSVNSLLTCYCRFSAQARTHGR